MTNQVSFSFDREPEPFSLEEAAVIARDLERLAGLAVEIALREGPDGVTVSDVREEAERIGILTGEETGERMKRLKLHTVCRRAGLLLTDRLRRSKVPRAHSNRNAVYVHPRFAGAA